MSQRVQFLVSPLVPGMFTSHSSRKSGVKVFRPQFQSTHATRYDVWLRKERNRVAEVRGAGQIRDGCLWITEKRPWRSSVPPSEYPAGTISQQFQWENSDSDGIHSPKKCLVKMVVMAGERDTQRALCRRHCSGHGMLRLLEYG